MVESVGVGLSLAIDASGALRVTAVDRDGPAARSGLVAIGDLLCEVDDQSVMGASPTEVRSLVVGPWGTSVTLGLRRGNAQPFYVRLTRGSTAHNAQLRGSRQHGDEAQKPPSSPPPSSRAENSEPCGIGLGIALDSSNHLRITSLASGGPAERSGLLKPGDILSRVDGRSVSGRTPNEVKPLIVGVAGSQLTLTVVRGRTTVNARLVRGKPIPPTAKAQRHRSRASESLEKPSFDATSGRSVPKAPQSSEVTVKDEGLPEADHGDSTDIVPAAAAPKEAGIGATLIIRGDHALEVQGLAEGGPAARSNMIKRGDVVTHVDDRDVKGLRMNRIRPLIVGPTGTYVTLTLQRRGVRGGLKVKIRRGTAAPVDPDRVTRTTPIPSPGETPLTTRPASPRSPSHGGEKQPKQSQNPVTRPSRKVNVSEGAVCGVGLVLVRNKQGVLTIDHVTEGGPAYKTTLIKKGDVLNQIDGKDVTGWTIEEVRPVIIGKAGSVVTLGIHRESEGIYIYVRVTRAPVRIGEISRPSAHAGAVAASVEQAAAPPPSHSVEEVPQRQVGNQQQQERQVAKRSPVPASQPEPRQQPAQGKQNAASAKQRCGIGAVLSTIAGGAIQIRSVNPGGPADKSGIIRRGDIIVQINGKSTANKSIEGIKPWIIGEEGTSLTLTIRRTGSQVGGRRQMNVTLIRAPVGTGAAQPQRKLYKEVNSRA